jgi:propanol-preferring alcohol dehydrogenase
MGSVEILKKDKALVYDKPGEISTKLEGIDTPQPGVGEVLVNLYVIPLPILTAKHRVLSIP